MIRPGATSVVACLAAACAATLWACSSEEEPAAPGTGAVALAQARGFFRPPKDRIPHDAAKRPGTPWGAYVGSAACAPCHQALYDRWKGSFHARTLYEAEPRTVIGSFTGEVTFEDERFAFTARPFRRADRFYVQVADNPRWKRPPPPPGRETKDPRDTYGAGLPPEPQATFEVLYAFGNRRHQPYVTRTADGAHWVLPVFWNDVVRDWRWDGWRPYVVTCATCHVTGIRSLSEPVQGSRELDMTQPRRWTPAPADEGWAEGAVSCELCHGPGRAHVQAARAAGTDGYKALVAAGKRTIYDPARDTPERRMQQCDSCHNFFAESPVTWVPGPDGYDHPMKVSPIAPKRPFDPTGQFYPDGTDMSPCTFGRVFRGSKMAAQGVECASCHDAHGTSHWADLTTPLEGNRLCLTCHQKEFPDDAALVRHTRHEARSPGSSCAECHMPRDKRFTNGIEVMSDRIHSHEFSVPTGIVREGGPPPSCNVCHVDRDAAWTREVLRAWKEGRPPPR